MTNEILVIVDAVSRENPIALYALFSYLVPILIVLLFPLSILVVSAIEKYSVVVMDLLCLSGIIGFCLTLQIMFIGAETESELADLFLALQGQIAFVLALGTAFSFHSSFRITFERNSLFVAIAVATVYWLNSDFLLFSGKSS